MTSTYDLSKWQVQVTPHFKDIYRWRAEPFVHLGMHRELEIRQLEEKWVTKMSYPISVITGKSQLLIQQEIHGSFQLMFCFPASADGNCCSLLYGKNKVLSVTKCHSSIPTFIGKDIHTLSYFFFNLRQKSLCSSLRPIIFLISITIKCEKKKFGHPVHKIAGHPNDEKQQFLWPPFYHLHLHSIRATHIFYSHFPKFAHFSSPFYLSPIYFLLAHVQNYVQQQKTFYLGE